jgi:hypothetical protein
MINEDPSKFLPKKYSMYNLYVSNNVNEISNYRRFDQTPGYDPSFSYRQQQIKLTSSSSSSPAAAFSALCRFLLGASSSSLSSAI